MKKIILSLLVAVQLFTSSIFLFADSVHAAEDPSQNLITGTGPWYGQSFQQFFSKVYDKENTDIFGERYTAAQVDWIIMSVIWYPISKVVGADIFGCFWSGNTGSITDCFDALSVTDLSTPVASVPKTPTKSFTQTLFEDRPISAITYFKDIGRKFDLVPEAQAQGFGFTTALAPVQDMWKIVRNFSYTIFVIITIIFAFMIMFRVKISPQVVITVQSALPKLITAIILVTFSFAIAGLLVDLMYVVYGVISFFAKDFYPEKNITDMFNFLTKGNLWGDTQLTALGLTVLYVLVFAISLLLLIFFTIGALGTIFGAGVFGVVLGAALSSGVGALILGVIAFVIVVMLIWHTIRILWTLLNAYVKILLLTIFAPLQITVGAIIPNFGFSQWLKSFVSALAVFVVTSVMFLFSFVFLREGLELALSDFTITDSVWEFLLGNFPKILAAGNQSAWPPLLGLADNTFTAWLFLGASFIIFTIIPRSAEVVQSMIQGKPFAFGSAIGESAKGPVTLGKGVLTGRVAKYEEGRRSSMGEGYEESPTSKVLRSLNITK